MGLLSMLLASIALVAGAPMAANAGDNMWDKIISKACLVAVNKEVPIPVGRLLLGCRTSLAIALSNR